PDPFHNYPDHLSLAHDQNRISFHFAAIDWSAPHKIKYSYRLIGAEYGWSHPSPEPSANYRNLSHGDYEFQVKAIGQSGEWTAPFTYRFTIRPAWWQTWWFNSIVISFAAFILLFIARLIYLYRLRKQRVLLEKQLAIQYERQRISAEMHDDIGAGLSGIRLLTEMTKNKIKDEQAAEEVEKIYRSVGDVSSKMKEVIWSLNTENDDLPNLIAYIQKQARALLEHYPCQLIIDVPDNIRDKKISGEARRNIFLVTKEALHNIIKHSAASKVNIIIKTDDKLRIQVSDNGKGFTKDQQDGQGNGMKNMRQRVQQLNGTLSIKNEDGLTLIFEIPI
ncbi:MAG TPA: ATP-binding protein, partial [Chitinophagaceae bacterium]